MALYLLQYLPLLRALLLHTCRCCICRTEYFCCSGYYSHTNLDCYAEGSEEQGLAPLQLSMVASCHC